MRIIILFIAVVVLVCTGASATQAVIHSPHIYFKTTASRFGLNDEFIIGVFLESASPINAFEIELGISPRKASFEGFLNSDSLVEVWPEEPEIFSDGIVKIRGAMLKPFTGKAGELIQLRFRAKEEGLFQMSLRQGAAYGADGKGTSFSIPLASVSIPISGEATHNAPAFALDETPPKLSYALTEDPIDRKYILAVQTEDRESGTKDIEYRTRKWLFWTRWERIHPPLKTPPDVWAIEIKVRNGTGLFETASLIFWKEFWGKLGIFAGMTILFSLILRFVLRRKKQVW